MGSESYSMGIRKSGRLYWVECEGIPVICSNFSLVVSFLLGNYPASEFYMPTFRNTVSSVFIAE
jgi:hypothetical protein